MGNGAQHGIAYQGRLEGGVKATQSPKRARQHQKMFPQWNNDNLLTGPEIFEWDFRWTNFFLAADLPPPPLVRVGTALSNPVAPKKHFNVFGTLLFWAVLVATGALNFNKEKGGGGHVHTPGREMSQATGQPIDQRQGGRASHPLQQPITWTSQVDP